MVMFLAKVKDWWKGLSKAKKSLVVIGVAIIVLGFLGQSHDEFKAPGPARLGVKTLPLDRSRAEIVRAFERADIDLTLYSPSEYLEFLYGLQDKVPIPWVPDSWRFHPWKVPVDQIMSHLSGMGIQVVKEIPTHDLHIYDYEVQFRGSPSASTLTISPDFLWYSPGQAGKEEAIELLSILFKALEPGEVVPLDEVIGYMRRDHAKREAPGELKWFRLGEYEIVVAFMLDGKLGSINIARVSPVMTPPSDAYPVPTDEPQPTSYLKVNKKSEYESEREMAGRYKYNPTWIYHFTKASGGRLNMYGPAEALLDANLELNNYNNEAFLLVRVFVQACDPNLSEELLASWIDKLTMKGADSLKTSVTPSGCKIFLSKGSSGSLWIILNRGGTKTSQESQATPSAPSVGRVPVRTLGVSYDQVMRGLPYFSMKEEWPVHGMDHYMGKSLDGLAMLEIGGHKDDISYASLMIGLAKEKGTRGDPCGADDDCALYLKYRA